MARTKTDRELVQRLRASGLRRKVAENVVSALDGARSRKAPPKDVARVIAELRGVAAQLQDRATGGSAKQRSEAAKKAAATRKRSAAKRSTAAKKGARTRAKGK